MPWDESSFRFRKIIIACSAHDAPLIKAAMCGLQDIGLLDSYVGASFDGEHLTITLDRTLIIDQDAVACEELVARQRAMRVVSQHRAITIRPPCT